MSDSMDSEIAQARSAALWGCFISSPESRQVEALDRFAALETFFVLRANGYALSVARSVTVEAMQRRGIKAISAATLARWEAQVRGVPRHHWVPLLLPSHGGGAPAAEIPPDAWHAFVAAYRAEGQNASAGYRRLAEQAAARGWTLPSQRTFERRLAGYGMGGARPTDGPS